MFEESDEFSHRPTKDENFNESVYVNGFEVYRQMLNEYKPKGVGRSTGLFSNLFDFGRAVGEDIVDAVLRFEHSKQVVSYVV